MEDEDLIFCVDPVYFGRAGEYPWLVWVSLTGDFPFREDLKFQAREMQAIFHSLNTSGSATI